MDRMMSTPLASRDTGRITHRISKTRDDFWKAQKEAFDKKDQSNGKDQGMPMRLRMHFTLLC